MKPIPDAVFYCVLCKFDNEDAWYQCSSFSQLEDAVVQIARDRSGSDRQFMLAELRSSFIGISEDPSTGGGRAISDQELNDPFMADITVKDLRALREEITVLRSQVGNLQKQLDLWNTWASDVPAFWPRASVCRPLEGN